MSREPVILSTDRHAPNAGFAVRFDQSPSHRTTTLLADDHEILLNMLRRLLGPDFDVVAKAKDAVTLPRVAPQLQADIAVIDMIMPGVTRLEAGRELHVKIPKLKLAYLAMNKTDPSPPWRFVLGRRPSSRRRVQPQNHSEQFGLCRRWALPHGRHRGGNVEELLVSLHGDFTAQISIRELEALQLLVTGLPMKSGARRLGITPRTVAFHKDRAIEEARP